jgi:hypothetical protein
VFTQREVFEVRNFDRVSQLGIGVFQKALDEAKVTLREPSVTRVHCLLSQSTENGNLTVEYSGFVFGNRDSRFRKLGLQLADELVATRGHDSLHLYAGAPSMAVVSPWAILMSVPWFTVHAVWCVTAATSAAADGWPLPLFFTPPKGR